MSVNPHPSAFCLDIAITASDIDDLGHVNNVVYLKWVQEVSSGHWDEIAPPAIKEKYLWVVLRHEIDFLKPVFLGESITGYTWVGDYQGAKFERYVTLYKAGTLEKVASAKTIWCLVDAKSIRPMRIEQELVDLLNQPIL
ncbi:thioesterase family protein [Rufibacter sp. LB8]|uniref:acyl-CoA thioesterase n=1 Tax=Rufibacter sp. LB8 TaxID=2777781 RepID=UPI00178C499C|nr:thioesterase family protein [Rufibacter sp. LB8]